MSIRIFATRGGTPFGEAQLGDLELTPDKEGSDEWIVPPSVRIEYGRPDLKSILRGEVETATGSMSVTGVSFDLFRYSLIIGDHVASVRFAEFDEVGASRVEVPRVWTE